MRIYTSYGVQIQNYNRIFRDTVKIYRDALDFYITVVLEQWPLIKKIVPQTKAMTFIEHLTHPTRNNEVSDEKYNFDAKFDKFPSYLRRAVIMDAIGKVSSYQSNYSNWENYGCIGNPPGKPNAGRAFPVLYEGNMYQSTGIYSAKVKINRNQQWVWLNISLKKSDIDYILRHCANRHQKSPSLVRHGKKWSLVFPFEEEAELKDVPILEQRILSIDLGINNACVCSVMTADGVIHGREFLKLPVETDRLWTAINRIKGAQQRGNRSMPGMWSVADGINQDIASKTAAFIIQVAEKYSVDVIVFEHLELNGKKHGSRKQRLHLWKAQAVQAMVTDKAHRLGMRISRVCAWNSSRLAFDGSGRVTRGSYLQDGEEKYNYSICVFPNGKQYNCDLNASYNIGARYFIREILKSEPETVRLALEAKVPSAAKRSTSTWFSLISLNAAMAALARAEFSTVS